MPKFRVGDSVVYEGPHRSFRNTAGTVKKVSIEPRYTIEWNTVDPIGQVSTEMESDLAPLRVSYNFCAHCGAKRELAND